MWFTLYFYWIMLAQMAFPNPGTIYEGRLAQLQSLGGLVRRYLAVLTLTVSVTREVGHSYNLPRLWALATPPEGPPAKEDICAAFRRPGCDPRSVPHC